MKPTITKEQADALLHLYSAEWTKSDVLEYHATGEWLEHCDSLNDLDILTLAAALVNGYEVEKTPEEKVREYYYDLRRTEDRLEERGESGSQFRQGWQSVEETLRLLGIEIEGVNA
ncbi:hypothetical protein QRX25_14975 [Bacillus sp. L381]|uniref:hypothetical protein n=1 Tax=Bacillus TaxID=1386 RepID=UPI001BA87435|nr:MULTISPECIES: hypothetical protein [Bacillus]MCR9040794.1 hypothetical protein [Bacillus velezensis]QUN08785.1 hypothetical protein KEF49_14775 [Bacillus amyloliquefaciens]QYM81857.1 hypothetical protein KTJ85_14620 [Bacillus sp. 7D3]QZY11003.1 hypothetical protein K7B13_14875 [Bacillus amyloliquefaciens]WIX20904.1 hypothetical protein QRX25_14975 [Bacillus sp. L381]